MQWKPKMKKARGKAIEDHPHDESLATADAVQEIKKEESSGKPDLKKATSKGLLAKASGAMTNLPAIAEDGVKRGEEAIGKDLFLVLALPFAGLAAFGVKTYKDDNSPYLMRLKQIREEFRENTGGDDFARKPQGETEYIPLHPFHSGERSDC